jgi:hypothetical protein
MQLNKARVVRLTVDFFVLAEYLKRILNALSLLYAAVMSTLSLGTFIFKLSLNLSPRPYETPAACLSFLTLSACATAWQWDTMV